MFNARMNVTSIEQLEQARFRYEDVSFSNIKSLLKAFIPNDISGDELSNAYDGFELVVAQSDGTQSQHLCANWVIMQSLALRPQVNYFGSLVVHT